MKIFSHPKLPYPTGPSAAPYSHLSPSKVAQVATKLQGLEYRPGEVIFCLKDGVELSQDYHFVSLDEFSLNSEDKQSITRAKLPPGLSVAQALVALRADPGVAYAEPNLIYHLSDVRETALPTPESFQSSESHIPDDLDRRLWGLHNSGRRGGKAGADISATEAWKTSIGGRANGPIIAVIDTGIDYKHPDLAANMWVNPGEIPGDGIDNDGNGVVDDVHGYNAFADNGDPMDDHAHGTHCAGSIAAVGNNGHGLVGVNWEANLMAVKIFDSRGNTSLDVILRGLDYAAKMGADITNNSWGDSEPSVALKDAFGRMDQSIHFAAAGNNRNNNDHRNYYPCGHDLPNMVSVAATDRNDRLPLFSNHGQKTVHLAAPGDEIISTVPGGSYAVYSGTSMAAPHAAGAAGLLLTEHPNLSPREVKERLIYNSDAVPALSRASVSRGRINAARSLETDRLAPASPKDFQVLSANSKGIDLQWTTTGDDGWCGAAPADVELWVSPEAIHESNLQQAQRLDTERPSQVGKLQSFHFPTGHAQEDRTFHFAFRFVDNVGNRSDLQSTSATVPAAHSVYRNEFGPDDGFVGTGDWARVQDPERGWVWTDSPEGKYKNGSNTSVTSPPISLKGKAQCQLLLDARHELWQVDKAVVEVTDDAEHWQSVGTYHSKREQWGERSFDLSAFDGKEVKVRVRLETDLRHNKDGIYLDNFRIIADHEVT